MSEVYGIIGQRHVDVTDTSEGRVFNDEDAVEKILLKYQPTMARLVSGGGKGVESIAERWARKNNIQCDVVKPVIKMFRNTVNPPDIGRGIDAAFHVRNTELIQQVDELIVFWNGTDYMVLAAASLATKMHRHVHIVPVT